MVEGETAIWAGGSAFRGERQLPGGVTLLNDLYDVERSLAAWR